MNKLSAKTAVLSAIAITSMLVLSGCKVEQTEEGALPDVEVTAEGGNLPKYDVETAEVQMGTRTVEMEVPTARVEMPSDRDSKVTDETDSSDQ
ncbi:MAG: hypothetical protein ACR2J7_06675 [Luteimonas sp.]